MIEARVHPEALLPAFIFLNVGDRLGEAAIPSVTEVDMLFGGPNQDCHNSNSEDWEENTCPSHLHIASGFAGPPAG